MSQSNNQTQQSSIDYLIDHIEKEMAKVDEKSIDNPVVYGMYKFYNSIKQYFKPAREMHRQEIESMGNQRKHNKKDSPSQSIIYKLS